jgi:ATP-dependent helicase/nuclease subunit B
LSYNAEMGTSNMDGAGSEAASQSLPQQGHHPGHEIDGWLQNGGLVIASSERARRALMDRYHRARRDEGLSAWPAPAILDWQSFLRSRWESNSYSSSDDSPLLLDPSQEKSIWAGIAEAEQRLATMLSRPRNRVAALAMQAHQLLCGYAPQYLKDTARSGWQQDAGIFSGWLTTFDQACAAENLLSPARLALQLIALLENEPASARRPALLLVGFDRILPVQRQLLDAWGTWQQVEVGQQARNIHFYRASDEQRELAACALWCRQKIAANPNARLLVISQDIAQRRGEMERAFQALAASEPSGVLAPPSFEFSLGVPLSKLSLAQSALLLLRWLTNPVDESDLDWLFSCELATDAQESAALQSYMRALRRRGLERPQWPLTAFLNERGQAPLPVEWVQRISEAQRRLSEQMRARRSPLDWAEFVPHLLQTIRWPGARTLSSEEFQVVRRWEQALESCAALGFDGRRISWSDFFATLAEQLDETLYAPESRDASIQIAGPAESAGLTADAIWSLGASEDAWPASGTTHPFLPLEVQRSAAMPHATAQTDWELSQSIVTRLISSAPEVCFSHARQGEDAETRPSRLILRVAGTPQDLPTELVIPTAPQANTETFEDLSIVPLYPGRVEGGAAVLTHQSQCPFKAFATARLAAQQWSPAEPCLTAAQRGQLLHAVLHSIWGGAATGGIRTLSELKAIEDVGEFVLRHVRMAMETALKRQVRDRLPKRYLEMEERRLNSLIGQWLQYELTRADFTVLKTEDERTIPVSGLTFDLRLDRIDELSDGALLVIDYKSGQVTPKSWEPPRPEDVQLPLYASFALNQDETLGGLAFAKVRRGNGLAFAGYVGDAKSTLIPAIDGKNGLVKNKLDDEKVRAWRSEIEKLAHDYLSGRAEVDPRDYPDTCKHCGLQSLCRIQEHHISLADDEDGEGLEEVADE